MLLDKYIAEDDRLDLPSASGIEQYRGCEASFRAQLGLESVATKYTEFGDETHDMVSGAMSMEEGSQKAQSLVKEMIRIRKLAANAWLDKAKVQYDKEKTIIYKENRFWFEDDNGKKLLSGKPDIFYILPILGKDNEYDLLIFDYKSGRMKVPHAKSNLQLHALALILLHNMIKAGTKVRKIGVVIVQPSAKNQYTLHDYKAEDILKAKAEYIQFLERIIAEGALFTPGEDQCHFCLFKMLGCPASLRSLGAIVNEPIPPDQPLPKYYAGLWERVKAVESMAKIYKNMIENYAFKGGKIEGYELTDGAQRRVIGLGFASKAFLALAEDYDMQEFMERFCEVSVTTLEDDFIVKNNHLAEEEARKLFSGILQGIMLTLRNKKSIKKEKKKKEENI